MNIFASVFQRLTIIDQSDTKLCLRELPVSDWLIAFVILIIATIIAVSGFRITAGIALGLALFFVIQGKIRLIDFDIATGKLSISYQSLLSKRVASEIPLSDIQRAYLFQGDDGGTQIVLVRTDAEEMGISAYSNDINPWKEDIITAITEILKIEP